MLRIFEKKDIRNMYIKKLINEKRTKINKDFKKQIKGSLMG